jgi:hypothetical protein
MRCIARRRVVLILGVFGRSDNAARCRSCRRAPAGDYGTALRAVPALSASPERKAPLGPVPAPSRGLRGVGAQRGPSDWSTSATRPVPGSAARTKTPTACCGSTSLRAPTFRCTTASTWTPSQPNSTGAHARRSTGKPQPSVCINRSPPHVNDHVLRRSLESALYPGAQIPHDRETSLLRSRRRCNTAMRTSGCYRAL